MRFEHELNGFDDVLAESPLPSTRVGSASVRIGTAMSIYSDDSSDFDAVSHETPEGRLSRSLQTWMIDHKWNTVEPMEKAPYQPIFSGKLGKESRLSKKKLGFMKEKRRREPDVRRCKTASIRRFPSDDSIHTSISLLTCSSIETLKIEEDIPNGKKRRRRKLNSRASTSTGESSEEPVVSKWVELSRRGGGALNRIFRNQALHSTFGIVGGGDLSEESEAFRLMDRDEQTALYKCGARRGIVYINSKSLLRSSSLSAIDVDELSHKRSECGLRRVLSSNATQGWGNPIDIAEIKRERMNRLLAEEQERIQLEKEQQRKLRRHALTRSSSGKSLVTSGLDQVTPTVTNTISVSSNTQSVISGHSSDVRAPQSTSGKLSQSQQNEDAEEKKITVWKGDRQILEIDLKKELTQRVKEKISSTRTALKRVTGFGDTNEQIVAVGTHDEYPKHIEEDFCQKPRMIQKMRISPHLSGIIHDDIQVRMGRPRYHEIRINDLAQWDKGQVLNRAHRNLKVFNWLHSLRDVEFIRNVIPEIRDEIPDEDSTDLELLHVESADEPDVKPMFRQYEVRIL